MRNDDEKMHDGTCHACGGMVDAEGFAMGGEVGELEGVGAMSTQDLPEYEGPASITDRRQKAAGADFADAVFRRRR